MRTAGLAALVAGGVAAAGFAIQWAALPDAGKGDVVAARATVWLGRYRETAGRLVLGGRRLGEVCYHGWIPDHRGRVRRGTLLRLSDGTTLRDFPPHTVLLDGPRLARPVALLYAAGCTRVLADRLAEFAQFDGHVSARRARIGAVPASAIDFPHLTLYVERRQGLPIGVSAFDIRGRFHFVRVARGSRSGL